MVRHDRTRSRWCLWMSALILVSAAAPPAAAQDDDIYLAVEKVMERAAKAREDGNCLGHGYAIIDANALVDAWAKKWPAGSTVAEILAWQDWAAAMRRIIAGESEMPCGDPPQEDSAVMADLPSETLPGMTNAGNAPPATAPLPGDFQPSASAFEAALAEAARLRAAGNCIAHVYAVADAERELKALYQADNPFAPGADSLAKYRSFQRLSARLEYERDPPCGEPRRIVNPLGISGLSITIEDYATDLLRIHNFERAAVGAPALVWNPALQASATQWAEHLAQTGRLEHAPREGRGAERENLQQLLPGTEAVDMLFPWISEKRDFVPGTFPDVSRTGDWNDISHFSQMIWPGTTDLGCGLAEGRGFVWLDCRYLPGGNRDGQTVGISIVESPANPTAVFVYFEQGSDVLSPQAEELLTTAAQSYRNTGKATVEIRDADPADTATGELADSRLGKVRDALYARGVTVDAIGSGDVGITFGRGP